MYRFLTCLIAISLLWACDPQGRTRKTPSPPPKVERPSDNPKDGGVVDVPTDVELHDTLKVDDLEIDLPANVDLPVGPRGARVSVLLPLFANRYVSTTSNLPKNSDWGLEYYAGLKLALEDLEAAGERGEIHVFDTQGDAIHSNSLIADPELRESHVLIAPYLTNTVKATLAPAKAAGLPVIVPYSAAADLGKDYPRLLQFNPGLLRHLDAMAAYLHTHYDPDQVVLVGLPTGEQNQEVAYLMKRHRELAPREPSWRTWQLRTADVGLQNLRWGDKFARDKSTIFVFPAYKDPKLVQSFMSQLQIGREGKEATVFGMPQWAEFKQLDPSIMEDLGVLITAGYFVDVDDSEVMEFSDRYSKRYGKLPGLSAYLGYDAMQYVLPLANDHGRAWPEHLPRQYNGLASTYKMTPVYEGSAVAGEQAQPSQYENTSIQILEYRNFNFSPVGR